MRLLTLFVFCLISLVHVQAQNSGTLTGSVKDKLTQEALIGVTIKIDGSDLGTVTDIDGNFRIAGIPPKSYNIVALYVGYAPQTKFNVVITTGNASQLNFELEPDSKSLGEVVVAENRSVRIATIETPLSIQNLSVEEIKSNPGGNFDISRVVQALPGVGGVAGTGAVSETTSLSAAADPVKMYFTSMALKFPSSTISRHKVPQVVLQVYSMSLLLKMLPWLRVPLTRDTTICFPRCYSSANAMAIRKKYKATCAWALPKPR